MSARIDAVLLDLGGVLIEIVGADRMLAWSPALPDMATMWNRWLASPAVRAYETGRLARDAFARGVIEEFGLDVDAEDFLAEFARWPRAHVRRHARPARATCAGASASRRCPTPTSCTGSASSATGACPRASTRTSRPTPWAGSSPTPTTSSTCSPRWASRRRNALFLDDHPVNVAAAAKVGLVARRALGPQGVRDALAELGLEARTPRQDACHEPAPPPARARPRGPPAARRADRRRQVRLDVPRAGQAHAGHPRRRGRRPRARAREGLARARRAGRPSGCPPRTPGRGRRARGTTCVTDDTRQRDRLARGRDRHRRHRQPVGGHPPRARLLRARQARRDGQRRGRRARRSAARAARARRRHRVLAGVRRPARADLRDGRLGARRRLRGRRRRQGHEVPARVPRVDAGDRVAALRLHAGDGRGRRLQRADVQLVPRRHQERDRDGGGRQRDGAGARARRPRLPAVRRRRPAARAASPRRRRAAPPRTARWR